MRYAITRRIKDALYDVDFPTWVRAYKDGTAWAGRANNGDGYASALRIRAVLQDAGFHAEVRGLPGTSGQGVVDIKDPHTRGRSDKYDL